MKIYLITANTKVSYDEYDAAVVVAEDTEEAIKIAKDHCYNFTRVTSQEMGTANDNTEKGVLLASFNAG